MHNIVTQGSYYEMGEIIGKRLKKVKIPGFPPKFSKKKLELSLEYITPLKKYAPDLLEEFKGISDASEIEFETIVAKEISPWRMQPQCLIMAIGSKHTKYGKPILARNQEWVEEDSEYLTLCKCKPDGKIESFGFTFQGNETSRYGGVNKAGLTIASASASFDNPGIGIMLNIATRWILDNCKNIEEAVKYLEEIPKVWGNTFIVIDRNDKIAKIEAHSKKTKVTRYDNEMTFNTLAFDSDEMQEYNRSFEWLNKVIPPRKKFIGEFFRTQKGKIDHENIQKVLKDHDNMVCDHSTDGKLNYGICWSWILTIGENEALISAGPPCKNEYQRINYFT
ncbi:MAG: C45 family autoproteolytic acyltransferase/hydrolase [Candidatus Hodarchaeales archaeon]|jgi:predicted choloylglycine hydrolase